MERSHSAVPRTFQVIPMSRRKPSPRASSAPAIEAARSASPFSLVGVGCGRRSAVKWGREFVWHAGTVKYLCQPKSGSNSGGGCHYSLTGTDGPPDWCTYKVGGSAPTAAPPSATVPASTSTSACDGVCGGGGGESASITARRLRHMTRPCTWNRRCHARSCTLTKVCFRRL